MFHSEQIKASDSDLLNPPMKEAAGWSNKWLHLIWSASIHSTGLVAYKPWALCIILVSSYYWPECA